MPAALQVFNALCRLPKLLRPPCAQIDTENFQARQLLRSAQGAPANGRSSIADKISHCIAVEPGAHLLRSQDGIGGVVVRTELSRIRQRGPVKRWILFMIVSYLCYQDAQVVVYSREISSTTVTSPIFYYDS